MAGGKARGSPSEVDLEVYAVLSLLDVGALIEVSVHKEVVGLLMQVEDVSFELGLFS